jgi:hypothetical protein
LVFFCGVSPSLSKRTSRSCGVEFTLNSTPASVPRAPGAGRPRPTAVAQRLELGHVDADADVLHLGEHRDERDLDLVVQRAQALGVERGEHGRHQRLHGEGLARSALGERGGRAVEVELTLGGTVGGQLELGVALQQLLEDVAVLGRIEQVGRESGVERQVGDLEPGGVARAAWPVGGETTSPGDQRQRRRHRLGSPPRRPGSTRPRPLRDR